MVNATMRACTAGWRARSAVDRSATTTTTTTDLIVVVVVRRRRTYDVVRVTMLDVRRVVRRRKTVWHRVIHSVGALHGIFNDNFKLKVRSHRARSHAIVV